MNYNYVRADNNSQHKGRKNNLCISHGGTSRNKPAAPVAIISLTVLWTLRALPPPVSAIFTKQKQSVKCILQDGQHK